MSEDKRPDFVPTFLDGAALGLSDLEAWRFAPWPYPNAQVVCTVPRGCGAVTRLYERGGRIMADTESGIPMIVPVGRK